MEESEGRLIFTVTDLKQYLYCPRVVYYTYCLPLVRPLTYKMEAGAAAHERAGELEQRRTLAAYGLKEGRRHFDVWVTAEGLRLQGRIDMVIEVGDELIPVDYKHTARQVGAHVWRQLAAYGMMLEETWGKEVRRGFVYSLVTKKAEEKALTGKLRAEVREAVRAMAEMVEREAMPEPPELVAKCVNCEFRRFCNDVL